MKEDATLKYQMWLDWFITDNKLDIEEVLYEGKARGASLEENENDVETEDGEESDETAEEDGEVVSVTLEQFLQKSLEMPGWQEDIRRFSMKAQYVGTDVLEKIREMCAEKVKKGFF